VTKRDMSDKIAAPFGTLSAHHLALYQRTIGHPISAQLNSKNTLISIKREKIQQHITLLISRDEK